MHHFSISRYGSNLAHASCAFAVVLAACMVPTSGTRAQTPGARPVSSDSTRPLERRGAENLVAFTKLLGYVRYFDPSDGAATADWERFALSNIDSAERAGTPQQLAARLDSMFRTLAPAVRVFASGSRPSLPAELNSPAGQRIVYWRHRAVCQGGLNPMYYSYRINGGDRGKGALTQSFSAKPYRGKKVRFAAAVRGDVSGEGNQARLWLRVRRSDGKPDDIPGMNDGSLIANDWKLSEIQCDVDSDADVIELGGMLLGEGSMWLDSTSFTIIGDSSSQPSGLKNPDFEVIGQDQEIAGWHTPALPYSARTSREKPYSGTTCAVLTSRDTSNLAPPAPAKPLVTFLAGSVWGMIPLGVYEDSLGTIPHLARHADTSKVIAPGNRTVRLATVALAWNAFQHFNPTGGDGDGALRRALMSAATDTDQVAFTRTLERMASQLDCEEVNVYREPRQQAFSPPILWDWVDNKLVVSYVDSTDTSGVKRGDVVLSVNGVASADAVAGVEQTLRAPMPQRTRFLALRQLRCGLQGSVLTIAIQTDAGSPRSIRLYRTIPEVALRDPRLRKISQIKPGIFYLDVERVSAEDFKAALPELEQAKGIVIDLRGEARGLNDEPVSHLIDSTISMIRWSLPVVTQPDRKHIVFVPGRLTVEPAQPRFNARLSYIADCRTSKNGESWLALVRQFKLGEIVGDASAGLDGIENSISLTGGYRILWVTATRQDNPRQQSAAIMPTVPVQRTIQGIREDRDELLERAIAAVSE